MHARRRVFLTLNPETCALDTEVPRQKHELRDYLPNEAASEAKSAGLENGVGVFLLSPDREFGPAVLRAQFGGDPSTSR